MSLKICTEKVHHNDKKLLDHINNHPNKDALKAAFYTSKKWSPNSVITVKFLDNNPKIPITSKNNMNTSNGNIDPLQQYFFDNPNFNITDAIKKIVYERIQPLVSLQFNFVDNSKNADIRISFDPNSGAWSLVGTDCQREDQANATMNFGWFDVSTVMHEFGHSIGLIHEHQNPQGVSIPWDKKVLYKWAEETQGWSKEQTDTNIINKYDKTLINGSYFDPLSIMLYFFPDELVTNGKGTHQNLTLSGIDMKYINEQYDKNNADTYFNKWYNKDISENINKSKNMAVEFNNPNPTDNTKNNPTDNTKNNPTDNTKNNPKNNPTDNTKNNPTDNTKNNPTDNTKNNNLYYIILGIILFFLLIYVIYYLFTPNKI
jgi:hypothetical protein